MSHDDDLRGDDDVPQPSYLTDGFEYVDELCLERVAREGRNLSHKSLSTHFRHIIRNIADWIV